MENLPTDHFITSLQFTPKTYQDVYPAIDPKNNPMPGKVVIVTGASRGIGGEGIAPAFAKAGVKGLVLVATGMEKLKETEAAINSLNPDVKTLCVAMDVSSEADVASLFEQVKTTFGHADVLINNAVVLAGGPVIHETKTDEFWSNFEVNVRGPYLLTKAFISGLPSPDYPATIATIVSFSAYQIYPFIAGYGISKLAAWSLAANVAVAYPNITSAVVHPGLVQTRQLQPAFQRFDLDKPELVGSVLVWLAADPERSRFMSGRIMSANWDVEGLLARKDEILNSNKLQIDVPGPFGKEQFEGKT